MSESPWTIANLRRAFTQASLQRPYDHMFIEGFGWVCLNTEHECYDAERHEDLKRWMETP